MEADNYDSSINLPLGSRLIAKARQGPRCFREEKEMRLIKTGTSAFRDITIGTLLSVGLLTVGCTTAFSQGRTKPETIEGLAMGTGTQIGTTANFRMLIYEYSNEQDRQILVQAFQKGQSQGLVNALSKMRAVGRLSLVGTLGYDCSFIRMIKTPTGRKIRFITNRPLRFGEVWADAPSTSYGLSGGEIDINDTDKKKSTGILFPRAELVIDKQGELQIELTQNAFRLAGIQDWKGTPGVN
jgi:hypothetical protein